jgi:hypothetical protein
MQGLGFLRGCLEQNKRPALALRFLCSYPRQITSFPLSLSLFQKTKPATGPIGPLCSRLRY